MGESARTNEQQKNALEYVFKCTQLPWLLPLFAMLFQREKQMDQNLTLRQKAMTLRMTSSQRQDDACQP